MFYTFLNKCSQECKKKLLKFFKLMMQLMIQLMMDFCRMFFLCVRRIVISTKILVQVPCNIRGVPTGGGRGVTPPE